MAVDCPASLLAPAGLEGAGLGAGLLGSPDELPDRGLTVEGRGRGRAVRGATVEGA